MNIPEDHFRNVPVGALSPSIEMQQKQQQSLLQRTSSFPNNTNPQTNLGSTNKQQKTSSFWNHFGIGSMGSKQDEDTSNSAVNGGPIPCTPSIATHDGPGVHRNVECNGLNEIPVGMAPRYV